MIKRNETTAVVATDFLRIEHMPQPKQQAFLERHLVPFKQGKRRLERIPHRNDDSWFDRLPLEGSKEE